MYFVADPFYQIGVKGTVRPANQRPPVPRAMRSRQPRAPAPACESRVPSGDAGDSALPGASQGRAHSSEGDSALLVGKQEEEERACLFS